MLIKCFFEFAQESLVGSVVNLSLFDLRNRFYRNVIHLDVDQFSEQGTSELMARFTNDMESLGAGVKTLFGKVVAEPLRALACILIACFISWQLTLMFLILVPIAALVLAEVGRLMKRATRRLLERMSSIYKILQESFQGIRVVKAFTMEPYERRRFRAATKDYYHKSHEGGEHRRPGRARSSRCWAWWPSPAALLAGVLPGAAASTRTCSACA